MPTYHARVVDLLRKAVANPFVQSIALRDAVRAHGLKHQIAVLA
jgi:hypothetical protein